jgi:hypothetical protein
VGIGAVAIGGRNVLGVVRINQDLTGDLVHRDFLTGEEKLIEHSVAAATTRDDETYGPIVAFVGARADGLLPRRNGLWGAELKLLPPPEERTSPRVQLQLPDWFLKLGSGGNRGLEAAPWTAGPAAGACSDCRPPTPGWRRSRWPPHPTPVMWYRRRWPSRPGRPRGRARRPRLRSSLRPNRPSPASPAPVPGTAPAPATVVTVRGVVMARGSPRSGGCRRASWWMR